MAINAQGIHIFMSDTGATGASTAATCEISGVRGFNGPSGQAAVIDVTQLSDTAGKAKMIGLKDEGAFSLDIMNITTDQGQLNARGHRNKRTYGKVRVKFNDSATSIMDFDAYVLSYTISGAVDGVVTGSIGMEISGAVTYTTA